MAEIAQTVLAAALPKGRPASEQSATVREMMNVREVAEFLNIKQRKVYDLLRQGRIPSSRVTGKWLFPRHLVERWVAQGAAGAAPPFAAPAPPPVVAGSHDPLLEWSLRESGSGLALLAGGSRDGLRRLAAGEAQVCGIHLLDPDSGDYNLAAVQEFLGGMDVVLLQWAWRSQGLVVARGNPLALHTCADLGGVRIPASSDAATGYRR